MEGKADEAPEHETGDIYVIIESEKHPKFRREGHNLHTSFEISLYEALLGFSKSLDHLDNHKVKLKRSSVTQPEFVDEIYGEGLPILDEDGHPTGRRGSLLVRYSVKLPSVAPKELIEALRVTPEHDEL